MTKKRIKVSVVITRMDLGGAQEVALRGVLGLDPDRFDAELISGEGGLLDGLVRRELGARWVPLGALRHPIAPLHDLWATLRLAWRFWRRGVDIVHTHSSKAGVVGRAAAWLAGVPAVVHTVHGWSFHDFMAPAPHALYRLVEKLLAMATDRLVVVADSLRRVGLAWGIGEQERYTVLRAASNLRPWRRPLSKSALLKILGIQGRPLVVGCVANAKEQKCPEDFVRVAAWVHRRLPGVHFVYVGDGPRRAAALSLASTFKLEKRVHFPGWSRSPEKLAAGFDVFLLTSLWEGLPCVFAQAMALGLPVVATQVGGAAELVAEGKTGFLCQPHDTAALADRVCALLEDAILRKKMGAAAKKAADRAWEIPAMVEGTRALYQELAGAA